MFKKFIKSSVLSLVALITLTSCTMLDNIIGTILANLAINLPVLVTGIDLLPSGLEGTPEQIKWETLPTNKAKPEDFNYLKNILIIPNLVQANIMGLDAKVELSAEFRDADNKDIVDSFKKISIGLNDLPEGMDFDLSSLPFEVNLGVDIYIPVGDSDILESVNGFDDLESFMETTKQSELIDATNQETTPFSIKIAVKSAKTTKTKTFYFRLTKPEFGKIILDEAFKLGFLVNLFEFNFNGDPNISFKQEEAADSENPLQLNFVTDSLIIPKRVTIKDVATIDVSYTFTKGSIANFFDAEESRNPSEFTDDPEVLDMIDGEITAYTLTPVGLAYKEKLDEKEITTVDGLADHIEAVTTEHNQEDLEDLYRASQSDPFDFELEITVSSGGESRSQPFYFNMKKAMLDDQILDFVIEDDNIVKKIHYSEVTAPLPVDSDNFELQLLTETVAFPETVRIPGFDERNIEFAVEFANSEDKDKFYLGRQDLEADDIGFDNADITVQTFTPIGDYEPETEDYHLEDFADEIKGMAEHKMEDLFAVVSAKYPEPINLTLTASLEKDGEKTSKSRQITINLVPADVDKEIIDYLIEDDKLINVINYENVEKIQNSSEDPTDYIDSVANSENIKVEHLADTIIIPSEIVLNKFGGRVLNVDSAITPVSGVTTRFESSQSVNIDGFDITAKTITSTGGYVQQDPDNEDLDVFANELTTKDIYKYSQAAESEIEILLTVSLEKASGELMERTKKVTIEFVPAYINETKIGDAIFDTGGVDSPYSVVNVLNADDYIANPDDGFLKQISVSENKTDIVLFFDTIIIPLNIEFSDFDGKTVSFTYDLASEDVANIDDYFLPSSKKHVIDGVKRSVQTLTPKAGFDADAAGINSFESLITAIKNMAANPFNPTSIALISANQAASTIEFTMTVHITIDGKDAGSRTYAFRILKTTF